MKRVKIGILHSMSGEMEHSETPLVAAAQMAIAEINRSGGVLNHRIDYTVHDGQSDPHSFSMKAAKAVDIDGSVALFGCWKSNCRKAVDLRLRGKDALLWYPVQYEGLEESANIVYTGSCANQQVNPIITWLLDQGHRSFCLIGSNYVFPRTVNKIIYSMLSDSEATIVDEIYFEYNVDCITGIVERIKKCKCDAIINTINGEDNSYFFRHLNISMMSHPPVVSLSISESDLDYLPTYRGDHYTCWSYFAPPHDAVNGASTSDRTVFARKYKAYCETSNFMSRMTSDPVATSYSQIYLWKACVERANSFAGDDIRRVLSSVKVDSPLGVLSVADNQHVFREMSIGRETEGGYFDKVWSSGMPIKPLPWLGVEEIEGKSVPLLKNLLSNIPSIIHGQVQREKKRVTYKKLVNQMSYGSFILRAVDEGRDFIFHDFYGASDVGYGLVKSNLIGASLVDTFPGVKSFGLFKVFQDVYRSGIPANHPLSLFENDFVLFWHESYVYKLPTGDIVFISNDITDKIRKEHDRARFNRRLKYATRNAGLGIWELNLKDNSLSWSHNVVEPYKLESADMQVHVSYFKKIILKKDLDRVLYDLNKSIIQGTHFNSEFRVRLLSQNIRYIKVHGMISQNKKGISEHLTGVYYDITDRKKDEKRVNDLAVTDPLTGLYNRRYLMDKLDKYIDMHNRNECTLSLAMIDIDHFKKVNDTYGHQCGDYALKTISDIIKSSLRSDDIVSRFGGEEFLLILMNTGIGSAKELISRVLEKCRSHEFRWNGISFHITFSAGVSDANELGDAVATSDDLIKLSDERLYLAKENGRNQIIIG